MALYNPSYDGLIGIANANSWGKRMTLQTPAEVATSARPQITAELMERTGLSDGVLKRLVHGFYDRVRKDPELGPIFDERIRDWGPHLARMVEFWSSVALMTGRYHGAPMPKHLTLPVDQSHFDRWLELFRQTATEICTPEGAAWVIERAERIAFSIHANVEDARRHYGRAGMPPKL